MLRLIVSIMIIFLNLLPFVVNFIIIPEVSAIMLDDDDDEDLEDIESYILKAQKAADNENFSIAEGYLQEAAKFGIAGQELEEARTGLRKKRQEQAERLAQQEQEQQAPLAAEGQAAPGNAGGSSSVPHSGVLSVRFETGDRISNEIDEYAVTIKKVKKLNGEADDYGQEYKEIGGADFFKKSAATFFEIDHGYIEIQISGYSKSRKVYTAGWTNILHHCRHTEITIFGDNNLPSIYCNN